MPRSWPPAISATRRPGKASMAARVGSTLVDRLSSTNVTPPMVPTGCRRGLRCSKPAGRALTQQVAVPVGDGQVGAGLSAGGQLVAVVVLDAAVPVQVVGVQGGDRDDRRRAGPGGGLVARRLGHPV